MSGGPVIIIDPNNKALVRSPLEFEETIAALRDMADRLEMGHADLEVVEEGDEDEG